MAQRLPATIQPPYDPLFATNQLRQPIRVTANPQLALGMGGGQVPATVEQLANQLVGGKASSIPGTPPGLGAAPLALPPGPLPSITDMPVNPTGAPGPSGPVPPTMPNLRQLTSGQSGGGLMSSAASAGEVGAGAKLASSLGGAEGIAAGGIGGLLGKLKSTALPAGKLARGGIGLGLPIAGNLLGQAAGGQESVLGRLLSGAGTGAGLGSLSGNLLGTAAGAAVGGVANVLFGGGEEGQSADDRWQSILKQDLNLPNEDLAELSVMYEILKETTGDDDAALAQVGQELLTRMMGRQQDREAQAKMLATQALTAQFFQPFTKQLLDSAQQRATIGERLADDLPENYRGIARMQNAASLDNATRTANAYAAQAQLLPAMASMQFQQGLISQAANQQATQGISNTGMAPGNLADLAAQIQGAA